MSAIVLAVVNQKGGVGKTTTVVNLAASLAEKGKRTLIIDCDPQGNCTTGLGYIPETVNSSVYDVVVLGQPITSATIPTAVENLWLVPATLQLAGAEIELVGLPRREYRLSYALEALDDVYDYILIDCPPSLGLLTLNAIVASVGLVVPIQCEFYALQGLSLLSHTISLVRQSLKPSLVIVGIVMTLYDARLSLAHQVIDEIRDRFGDELLEPFIPRSVRLSEAPSHGLPITAYDPGGKGTKAYLAVADALEARIHSLFPTISAIPEE